MVAACLLLLPAPWPLRQVSISYLEIYNEMGYDLLNPDREVKGLEDLPQVTIQEDEEEVIHYRNLSTHRAGSEEEALNLVSRQESRGDELARDMSWQKDTSWQGDVSWQGI